MDTILVIILILVVGIGLTGVLLHVAAPSKDAIATFQTVLAIFGLLLAGYWYFVERKGEPHVDLTQTAVAERIAPNFVAVEASVAVKNLGTTLVHLRSADIRLQQVRPWRDDMLPLARLTALGFGEWPAAITADGRARQAYKEAELLWPTLRQYASNIGHEVEPGETDTITATFVVSCRLATVRVATNLERSDDDPMAHRTGLTGWFAGLFRPATPVGEPADTWKVRSFVDVAATCKSKS